MTEYRWARITRRFEGPGERYEGRVSKTPIMGIIHTSTCISMGTEYQYQDDGTFDTDGLVDRLVSDGVRSRHIMGCMSCGTSSDDDVLEIKRRVEAALVRST